MSFSALFPQLTTFPLRAIRDGKCTCLAGTECKSVGKHPACFYRQLAPRHKCTGADGCPACFSYPVPACGYGIVTGANSGLFVVDQDGAEEIRTFYALGPVPRTFAVRRGPDRLHLYFSWPGFRVKNSVKELVPGVGIDIKGDGGFVVGPGSPHKSRMVYEIADDVPLAPAPEWLLKWPGLRQPKVRLFESTSEELQELESRTSAPRAWRIARARAWLALQPPAISGETGHKTAMRTISIAVRENRLTDAGMVREAIESWNARCQPPWKGAELEHKVDEALHSSTVPWSKTLDIHYTLAALEAS